ncbi:hypothetical protein PAMC26510_03080 [Caballeronia sordidicola]|uniref:Uncharacterized protein n=1 Tax=Caballeronia sordidicola TaxID=196367 RepID=A0A2C9XWT9_CABSO|nr:hypothetical protein PAMC26510_03080 [Caballeronia sordidicola]
MACSKRYASWGECAAVSRDHEEAAGLTDPREAAGPARPLPAKWRRFV